MYYVYFRSYFSDTESWFVEVTKSEYLTLLASERELRMGNMTPLAESIIDRDRIEELDIDKKDLSERCIEIAVC